MCAIVDANCWHEVFSPEKQTPAGGGFRRWLASKRGFAVLGGKLLREIAKKESQKKRVQALQQGGLILPVPDAEVDEETSRLEKEGGIRSDDPHILALARVGGARLLYSNDRDLHDDFRDARFLDDGKIYSTLTTSNFDRRKRNFLNRHHCQRRR